MEWLHKDLEEMPGDPRTIYYLGHAHLEQIGPTPAQDVRTGGPGAYHVHKALGPHLGSNILPPSPFTFPFSCPLHVAA